MIVERCRFLQFQPEPIQCLAFEPHGAARLAVARQDGSIEIWSRSGDWHLQHTIPGCEGLTVEALVWTEVRPRHPVPAAPARPPRDARAGAALLRGAACGPHRVAPGVGASAPVRRLARRRRVVPRRIALGNVARCGAAPLLPPPPPPPAAAHGGRRAARTAA